MFPLIQMASFRLLGVSLFSARLTPAPFSVAMSGLVVLLVRRFADPITALLAVVLLATNFINYYLGKPVYFYQLIEKLPEP